MIYLLVDCNSFFCSCERLFRPDLAHRPVGVLSGNDGCFVARSPELKKIGIKMGEPYFKVKGLCDKHQVSLFSSNFPLYANLSDRVMRVLAHFSTKIEVYSIDEAFMTFHDSTLSLQEIETKAKQIKFTVERYTGIPVSIGLGRSKTQAKVANNYAKKNPQEQGVTSILQEEKKYKVYSETLIGDVWGIGHASRHKMNSLGIFTAFDLSNYTQKDRIQKVFSIVGRQRQEELQGQDHFKLEFSRPKKKGIMRSRSFSQDIFDFETLKKVVAHHTTQAARKLRGQQSVCHTLQVYIRTSPFKKGPQYRASHPIKLLTPSSDTRVLIKVALQALTVLFKNGYAYKKVGVCLLDLTDAQDTQMNLFTKPDPKSDKLMQTIDLINKKQGLKAIGFAACKLDKSPYHTCSNHRSPHYLTDWHDIPVAI